MRFNKYWHEQNHQKDENDDILDKYLQFKKTNEPIIGPKTKHIKLSEIMDTVDQKYIE